MIRLEKLDKNVCLIKDFIDLPHPNFCDISLGVKYIWRKEFPCEFCIEKNTLILKESSRDYKDAFYYPIGSEVDGVLEKIEEYAKEKGAEIVFCCIDNSQATLLAKRYPNLEISNDRNWSDYIYDSQEFKSFSGKKFSGQRNHVNKFKKSYPNCVFKKVEKEDIVRITEFIKEQVKTQTKSSWTVGAEAKTLKDYVENALKLNQVGGVCLDGDKVIGVAFGEIVNDTLIVHVEKADKTYQGVYPFLANSFANAFANEKVKYINREEDCGDMGLRISKLQYQPIEIKQKNLVRVLTLFGEVKKIKKIQTSRLTITPIYKRDIQTYYKLYTDKELNVFWGYDYTEDLSTNPAPQDFYNFMKKLEGQKQEISFAVRLNGEMIGELVVHNFGFYNDCEIGYRFFKEHHNKGYAYESASALIECLTKNCNAKKLKTRCFIQNEPSKKLALKLGYKQVSSSKTHHFFEKQI